MGNRHHDKRMRARVRARMQATGESYQRALAVLHARERVRASEGVDLVRAECFGVAATIATFELVGSVACVVVTSGALSAPRPRSPLFALEAHGPKTLH